MLGLDIEVAARPGARPGQRPGRPGRVRGRRGGVRGRPGRADAGRVPGLPDRGRGGGVRPGGGPGRRQRQRHAGHRARGQGPAVGRGGGARAGGRARRPRSSRPSRGTPAGGRTTPGCSRSACAGTPADLPALADLSADSLASFGAACAARDLGEERRLAYVAATRAAFWLACSGYWWGDAASPLGPSVFLDRGAGGVRSRARASWPSWAPPPEDGAENPVLAEPPAASWPAAPGAGYDAVREAAELVQQAMAADRDGGSRPMLACMPRPELAPAGDRAGLDGGWPGPGWPGPGWPTRAS